MTVAQILVESSNIGTIARCRTADDQAARRTGSTCAAFGLGEATALDFPGESPGILKHWSDLWGSERVTVAYGQGVVEHVDPARRGDQHDRQRRHLRRARSWSRSIVGPDGTVTDAVPSATREVVRRGDRRGDAADDAAGRVPSGTGELRPGQGLRRRRQDRHRRTRPSPTARTSTPPASASTTRASSASSRPRIRRSPCWSRSTSRRPATIDRFGGTAAAPVFAELAPTIVHELGIVPAAGAAGCEAG